MKTVNWRTIALAVMFVALGAVVLTSQAHASDDDSDSDSDCEYGCGGGGGGGDDNGGGGDATGGNATGGDATATGGDASAYGGEATATGGVGTANNEGIDVQVDASDHSTTTTENNSSNIVLVPNNNTENCLRVWGLAFGRNGESAALGLPFRSKKCDYEQAADDAFAQGEREIGWFWKCENSNLSKSFKEFDDPSAACLARMIGSMTATTLIATQSQLIEDYEQREQELKQACNKSKNRMMEACVSK